MDYEEKKRYLESYALLELEKAKCKGHDKLTEIESRMHRIEEAVNSIKNDTERKVLWFKYIGRLSGGRRERVSTLWEVGNILGYAEVTVKNFHRNGVRNLKIEGADD